MENKPRKSNENNFMTILNLIVDPAVIVDEKGHLLLVNNALEEMTGLNKKEIIGKAFFELNLLPPKSKKILLENLKKRMQGLPVEPYEVTFTDKTGKVRYVEIKAKKIDYVEHSADLVIFRDITRRKENARRLKEYAEKMEALVNKKVKEVKESEERYRELTESISDVFFAMDKNLRYTYWNKASEKLTGTSAKDAIGKHLTEIFPDVKGTGVEQFYKKVLRTKQPQSFVNKYRLKNKDFIFEISAYPTMDGLSVFVKDITEHKKAEETLKESEEKFRNLGEQSPNMIFINQKGRIVYANKKCEEVMGYKREEFYSPDFDFFTLIAPEYIDLMKSSFSRHIKGEEVAPLEYALITKEGKRIEAILTTKLIAIKGETAILGIVTDITERKESEEALRMSEEKYRELINGMNDTAWVIDFDGNFIDVNDAAVKVLGYSRKELLSMGPPDIDNSLTKEQIKDLLRNMPADQIQVFETAHTTKDGKPIPVEISSSLVTYQGKQAILSIARDITERKIMQDRLAEYSQKLEKIVEKRTEQLKRTQAKLVKSERLATIGELAAMVGHDLRNPLTGIMGAAYYLKAKHGTEMGAKGKEMLETIENAINHSNKIINDLLEYSRDLKLEFTETTLKAMLQSALSSLEVPEKIQVIDATKDTPTVKADTEKIRNVFVRIIQNAIDAMPEGGTLTIKSRKVKGKLEIAFKDTGVGMSEENLSKLEGGVPLFTTKAKGMGFGLPICRRLAEVHGGKICVESTVGKGTTVTVTIPVNPEPVDESEEKWIFSESMLSAITSTQRAP